VQLKSSSVQFFKPEKKEIGPIFFLERQKSVQFRKIKFLRCVIYCGRSQGFFYFFKKPTFAGKLPGGVSQYLPETFSKKLLSGA